MMTGPLFTVSINATAMLCLYSSVWTKRTRNTVYFFMGGYTQRKSSPQGINAKNLIDNRNTFISKQRFFLDIYFQKHATLNLEQYFKK